MTVAEHAAMTCLKARWPLSAAARWRRIDRLFAPLKPAGDRLPWRGDTRRRRRAPDIGRAHPGAGARVAARAGRRTSRHCCWKTRSAPWRLHYRLAPEARPALEAALEDHHVLFATEKVTLQEGKAVIEAKPAGHRQGRGRARPAGARSLSRAAAVLFGGDDTTDLDVFQHPARTGRARLFGGPPFRRRGSLFPVAAAVRQWLTQLAERGVGA